MAFINLKTENENLSWIIQKNPGTQASTNEPFKRNGKTYSNFLWFESDKEISLYSKYLNHKNNKNKFDNLDFTQNTKGEVYLQLIDTTLRTALTHHNDLDNQKATLKFNLYNKSDLDYKERIPEYVTVCETTNYNSYIEIEAPSIKKALEVCCALSLITSFQDKDYYVENSQYMKYFKFIVDITKEYSLLRQAVSFIKSDALYKEALPLIETTPFIIGRDRAFDARKKFYISKMAETSKSKNLLEIGAGEGKYFKSHLKYYDTVVSLEPDEEPHHDATHMIRKIKADEAITLFNIDAMSHLEKLDTLENTDVLLTEVLEHVEFQHANEIINKVLELSPDKFMITLPNHDFNTHYGYKPGEFRHDDHLWEPTVKEFNSLYDSLSSKHEDKYSLEKYFLGDCERENTENCATFGLLFTKV